MAKIEIKLPQQLDLGALPALKEELVLAFNETGDLVIDGAEVERVGTPAIQLLLAAASQCAAEPRGFALQGASPALAAAFDDLGLGAKAREWSAV